MSPPPLRSLLVALAGGALVLAAGVVAATRVLPEARGAPLPERERFTRRFLELVRRQGAEPATATPRLRLASEGDETSFAYRRLGGEAAEWLARHGRGVEVEVSAPVQWGSAQGTLKVRFASTVEPWAVEWTPVAFADFFSNRAAQPEGICGLLLRGDESLGDARRWSGGNHVTTHFVVVGAGEPTHLQRLDPIGGSTSCARRPGVERVAGEQLPGEIAAADVVELLLALVLPVATLVLFVLLALRGRVDLSNALVLAGTVLLTTVLGSWPSNRVLALFSIVATAIYAVWLLVLWSTAESWARVHWPGFTTSLDTLRRGRLGGRAGRALLAGTAAGAALAGARLLLLALAGTVPALAPAEAAARLPLFALGSNPLSRGAAWVGVALLALTAAHRLTGRWSLWLAPPLVALAVAPVELRPWVAGYAGSTLLAAGVVWVFRRAGLTAAVTAALLTFLLPVTLQALRHASWVPLTAVVASALTLLPVALGFVGLSRDESVERDPGAVPEFLRREEREKRLTYEMDLLARMQLGLLPQSLPRLPGYELTARSILATEAGGDLYDFLRDERGRLWIAAGDVSGHGYSCAIAQASLKAALLSLVDGNATPARVLDRIDRVLRSSVAVRQFATLVLGCLEEASGRLVLANAGHPFPLLAEPGRGAREVEYPGLPLGQGPPRRYRDHELMLAPGSVLLLHSDGLFEALDANGRPYGFDRPRQILAEAAQWNAAEILERVLYDWRRHTGGAAPADDTTLVVLKRG